MKSPLPPHPQGSLLFLLSLLVHVHFSAFSGLISIKSISLSCEVSAPFTVWSLEESQILWTSKSCSLCQWSMYVFNALPGSFQAYLSFHFLFAYSLNVSRSSAFRAFSGHVQSPGYVHSSVHVCGISESQDKSEDFKVPIEYLIPHFFLLSIFSQTFVGPNYYHLMPLFVLKNALRIWQFAKNMLCVTSNTEKPTQMSFSGSTQRGHNENSLIKALGFLFWISKSVVSLQWLSVCCFALFCFFIAIIVTRLLVFKATVYLISVTRGWD